ncbi:LysM peptidoglycan-binding domain-containing protein [Chengkuizengella axinellae]|uniref:LysM peptidoglycan-binding domain-containing protein n=1 Tax=Chengkuizengella axinellae TaxID=3064388 RepID=A0ABT9IUI9_9BACL|nr:LysM peptidoglycan-binding domain-containing protein [Chengkuizengella sp. 2205SS18-9]MDP5272747.1 LysM peptidoglycan-binding domain-containing protein [Chengkuizengella sp. 2205SS18-9]
MKIHIIKKGESLDQLCKKYEVDIDKILQMNTSITRGEELTPGKKLKIPSKAKHIRFERREQSNRKAQQMKIETKPKSKEEAVQTGKHKDLFDEFNVPAAEVGNFYDVPQVPELNAIETKPFKTHGGFQHEQNSNLFHPQTPYDVVQPDVHFHQFQGPVPNQEPLHPWNQYVQPATVEPNTMINPYMSFVNTHHYMPSYENAMHPNQFQVGQPAYKPATRAAAKPKQEQAKKETLKKETINENLNESKANADSSAFIEEIEPIAPIPPKQKTQAKVKRTNKRKSAKNKKMNKKNNKPWINL